MCYTVLNLEVGNFTKKDVFLDAGKYAQVTNNPENDGCINGVLLV